MKSINQHYWNQPLQRIKIKQKSNNDYTDMILHFHMMKQQCNFQNRSANYNKTAKHDWTVIYCKQNIYGHNYFQCHIHVRRNGMGHLLQEMAIYAMIHFLAWLKLNTRVKVQSFFGFVVIIADKLFSKSLGCICNWK